MLDLVGLRIRLEDVHARLRGKESPRALDHCWVDVDTPNIRILEEVVPDLQRLAEGDTDFGDVDDAVADGLEEGVVQVGVLVIVVALVSAICRKENHARA